LIEFEAKPCPAKIDIFAPLVAGNSLVDLKINLGPKRPTKTALKCGLFQMIYDDSN